MKALAGIFIIVILLLVGVGVYFYLNKKPSIDTGICYQHTGGTSPAKVAVLPMDGGPDGKTLKDIVDAYKNNTLKYYKDNNDTSKGTGLAKDDGYKYLIARVQDDDSCNYYVYLRKDFPSNADNKVDVKYCGYTSSDNGYDYSAGIKRGTKCATMTPVDGQPPNNATWRYYDLSA